MFWRLGAQSAWRNLMRSMLAILSMAMAAGFLTNAISFSRGYAAMLKVECRSIQGGEIIAYAPQVTGLAPEGENLWHYQKPQSMWNSDLGIYYPELFQSGYLTSATEVESFEAALCAEMAKLPGVTGVYPRYQMPAYTQGHSSVWATPLRGRDLGLDQRQAVPTASLVREGRWFSQEDEDQMVAVVSSQQHYPPGQQMTGVGDTLHILVPQINGSGEETHFDYTRARVIELKVIGVLDVFTRNFNYTTYSLSESGMTSGQSTTSFYAQLDEIQLPLTTWQRIWREAGGSEYLPQQVALMSDNVSYLADVVESLRSRYPRHSFFSVPELVWQAESRLLIEDSRKLLANSAIRDRAMGMDAAEQTALAMDLRVPMTIMIFVNAALVIASNLLIMVSERRTEVGILKAVGAKRIQVVTMVLAEALLISCLGAFAGFLFFRLPAMFNQLTNGVAFGTLLLSLLWDLLLVFGATTAAALLFGLLPARTMAGLSVREVLQSE